MNDQKFFDTLSVNFVKFVYRFKKLAVHCKVYPPNAMVTNTRHIHL